MGTNTLSSASDGTVIPASDNNQYKTALGEDLVPRNTSGVPTDQGGSLGTTILRWLNAYINKIFIGAIASALTIEESSGDLVLSVGGSSKKYSFKIASNTPLEVSDTALTHRVSGTSCLESNNTNFLYKISGTNVIEANGTNFLYKIGGVTKGAIDTNGFNRNYFGPLNYGKSSSATAVPFSTTSGTLVDVTNCNVTITTNGRPVLVFLEATSGGSYIGYERSTSNTSANFVFVRTTGGTPTTISYHTPSMTSNGASFTKVQMPPSTVQHLDVPSSGTHTYKLQVSANTTTYVSSVKIVAIEL